MKRLSLLLTVVVLLTGATAWAQTLTGTVAGQVMDEQGAVLPGVTVTLTGRQGSQVTVSDGRGEYRFVGLTPGAYEVKAELSGFTTQTEQNVDVGIGKTMAVAFTMRVSGLTETVDVIANSSSIDVTTAATDTNLSQDLLFNMPINIGNFNTATDILNSMPGINSGSAFGGDEDYGSALMIDGVDTRDPEAGSSWVFYNFNIVEEIQVGGLGAPAEYGGFTGAVVNTITKSGGNRYSALFEIRHTNDGLAGDNISDEYIRQNANLADTAVLNKLNDYTVQFGGPFRKDKAFYWASVQRYALEQNPSGPRTISTEVSPRYNGKLTFQLSPTDTIIGSTQWDNYNVTGRDGFPGTFSNDNQTVRQDSPEAVWNAQYRKVFGSNTFLEAKYTGYWGYYYLDPVDETPARLDLGTGEFSGGGGYWAYYDRKRNQVNASLSTYAEAYGKHNFKFGLEIERSMSRNRSEYSDNIYYLDYYGAPYLAYTGPQYDIQGNNKRTSAYAQDNWQVGRLTANLGLRLDHIRGTSPRVDGDIYTPDLAWGPRVGAAFDLTGKGTSVLKGFWGRYYEGAATNPFGRAIPGYYDYVSYEVLPNGRLIETDRVPELVYGIDENIKHFGLDEANVSWEQQIRRNFRFAATGIWREYRNFVASLIPRATWTPFAFNNGLTGGTTTLYRWANRAQTDEDYLIRNVDGYQYRDPSGNLLATADPNRDYKGLMLVLTKAYSNRWRGQFSYVWSEAKGNVGNTARAGFGGTAYENPSLALVNTQGFMENDRTHEFKLFGGYQVPFVEVAVNAAYKGISGRTFTPVAQVSGTTLNTAGSENIFLEPRGSRRYDTEHQIDLRVEKVFRIDVHRFGLFVDFQNLTNADTILAVQTRYPRRTISGNNVEFNAPTSIQGARQITIGGRWSF